MAPQAQVIVVGNEKGGAGKSTIAVHVATALLHADAKVAVIDLDLRQRTTGGFFEHRAAWTKSAGVQLPMPLDPGLGPVGVLPEAEAMAGFEAAFERAADEAHYVLIDTPGGDTPLSRAAHARADLIITPMNDSFVDFELLGRVDPVTLNVVRPSIYAEAVWDSRKAKAVAGGRPIDWVVLRNRLAPAEARNRKRLEERMVALSRRIGFRIGPGLRDRVIYRELFPFGLTVADLSPGVRPVAVSLSHVAARQEVRGLMQFLGLADGSAEPIRAAS